MLFWLVTSVAIISDRPRPVYLALVISALAYFVAPVIYFLNLYDGFKIIPKDQDVYYPEIVATWLSWLSLVVFPGMSLILNWPRILRSSRDG